MRFVVLTGLGLAWLTVVGIAQSAEVPLLARSPETLNRVSLIRSGAQSLELRRNLIDDSQRLLWITVPFWDGDQSGTELMEKIEAKQKEAAEAKSPWTTRILQGWIVKFFGKNADAAKKRLGDVVRYWNPPWWQRNFSFSFKRGHIHDKFFISDDRMILGGRNIGDGYFTPSRETPGFFDLDLSIDGPAARIAAQNQLKLWTLAKYLASSESFPPFKKEEIRAFSSYFYDNVEDHDFFTVNPDFGKKPNQQPRKRNRVHIPIRAQLADPAVFPALQASRDMDVPVTLLHDSPLYDRDLKTGDRISKTFEVMKEVALRSKQIRIFTPYATFDEEMIAWLRETAKRGVQVTIITNSLSANDMGEKSYKGAASHYLELLEAGVRIGEWQGHRPLEQIEDAEGCQLSPSAWPGNTLHAKVVLFDESSFLLGSNNLNSQSLRRNSEVMAYVRDENLAAQIADVFEDVTRPTNSVVCGNSVRAVKVPQLAMIDEARVRQIWAELKITKPTYDYPTGN